MEGRTYSGVSCIPSRNLKFAYLLYLLTLIPVPFGFCAARNACRSGAQKAGHVPTSFGLHHPKFAIDEEALHLGAAVEAQFVFDAVNHLLNRQIEQEQLLQQEEPKHEDEL